MGLPVELALDIMAFADYKPPKGKLNIPHDPLHPSNGAALRQYLKYCWQSMVRCYTMATELGMDPIDPEDTFNGINWKNLVGEAIIDLFGHHKDQGHYNCFDLEFPEEKLPRVWYKNESVSDDDAPRGWRGPFTFFV